MRRNGWSETSSMGARRSGSSKARDPIVNTAAEFVPFTKGESNPRLRLDGRFQSFGWRPLLIGGDEIVQHRQEPRRDDRGLKIGAASVPPRELGEPLVLGRLVPHPRQGKLPMFQTRTWIDENPAPAH